MVPLLGPLRQVLIALQGGGDPRHLAAGFALGAAMGLVPKGNLFGVAFLLLFFFFNVNKGMALLSAFVFTGVGYLFDGPAHALGRALLMSSALKPLWTALYDLPVVPLTRFNNTVVLGNLVIGLIFYIPLYMLALRGIAVYNEKYRPLVEKWPIVKALKGMSWYQTYERWLGQ